MIEAKSLLAGRARTLANLHATAHVWDAALAGYRDHFPDLTRYATYREDFNGGAGSGWGPNFRLDVNTPQVSNNAAQPGNLPSNSGTTAFWGTYTGGSNGGAMYTDNVLITASLITPMYSTASNMNCSIVLRSPDTFTGSGTTMVVINTTTGNGSAIYTYSGSTGTARATTSTSVTAGALLQCGAVGNHYAAFVGGIPLISWDDTTGVVKCGAGQRRWGIEMEANYPLFQQQFDSLAIDWVTAVDL
ncbi:hypothetical protein [Nocardia sp. NPDC046763]|uniref:DUF7257 domain-containing protein n=1 Tax=Nocardia sp. NPDC046763 TaxID=3155256 RepID=UPI0033C87422